MEWRPIESAPKDQIIDIWLVNGRRWTDCYYDSIRGEWRCGHLLTVDGRHVSHWMPQPEPPK